MTELVFGLVSSGGLWMVAAAVFLSCLGLPLPCFAAMLAGGALAAAGDLDPAAVWAVAWLAAMAGDQTGFRIGRWAGPRLTGWLRAQGGQGPAIDRAILRLRDQGGRAVFLTRWLVAPLGPLVNVSVGAAGFGLWRFTLWDAAGEAVRVSLHVALGHAFAPRLAALTAIVSDWGGFVSAATIALALGWAMLARLRSRRRRAGSVSRAEAR